MKNFIKKSLLFIFLGLNIICIDAKAQTYDLTNALPKNYVKDGTVDYTKYIQDGINNYSNISFPDFPILINDLGLDLKSDSKVYFPRNAKLLLKTSRKERYEMIRIHGKRNIELNGGNLVGDRETHIGNKGEWGVGLSIYSSTNIAVKNLKISNCWGDGITISKSKNGIIPNFIQIYDPIITKCRRNGISIGAAKKLEILRANINAISGAAPGAGIDIEPANQDYQLDGIVIESATTSKCVYGILLALERASGSKSLPINIDISNHVDNSSSIGFRIAKFRPIYKQNIALRGRINVANPKWNNNRRKGLLIEEAYDLIPSVYFQGRGLETGRLNSNKVFINKK